MFDKIENLVTPIRELSDLAVSNTEKLTELQLKGIEQSANACLEAFKSATAIKDIEDLQAYISAQAEVAETVANNAKENANIIAELGKSYADEAKILLGMYYLRANPQSIS